MKANCSKTEVLNRETKLFEAAYWSEIEVGDYVRVTARETVPADLLIVQVTPLTVVNLLKVYLVFILENKTNMIKRIILVTKKKLQLVTLRRNLWTGRQI
jgi:hypothetical protein